MKFKIDYDGTQDMDMEAGFAAWDDSASEGLLYGAGYSHKREIFGDATNGIDNINEDKLSKVNSLTYESNKNASYFGGPLMADRVYLTGTPSGTCIMDFGLNRGGGGGLAIPQASSKDMSSSYYGTYFCIMYEYQLNSSTDKKSIRNIKAVISNDGTNDVLRIFDMTQDTSKATPTFETNLIPVTDLDASQSPGGTDKIIDQFANVSGNANANSTKVKSANNCYGAFIAKKDLPDWFDLTTLIFDPQGRFAGFTGFGHSKTDPTSDYNIRFGFAIKDPNYSNSGL